MADKIVTLKDKNNNNLYPVAGALHADTVITGSIKDNAVNTPKIANNAVTSDKIDWTTILFKNNLWTNEGTVPVSSSTLGSISLFRISYGEGYPVTIGGYAPRINHAIMGVSFTDQYGNGGKIGMVVRVSETHPTDLVGRLVYRHDTDPANTWRLAGESND